MFELLQLKEIKKQAYLEINKILNMSQLGNHLKY